VSGSRGSAKLRFEMPYFVHVQGLSHRRFRRQDRAAASGAAQSNLRSRQVVNVLGACSRSGPSRRRASPRSSRAWDPVPMRGGRYANPRTASFFQTSPRGGSAGSIAVCPLAMIYGRRPEHRRAGAASASRLAPLYFLSIPRWSPRRIRACRRGSGERGWHRNCLLSAPELFAGEALPPRRRASPQNGGVRLARVGDVV